LSAILDLFFPEFGAMHYGSTFSIKHTVHVMLLYITVHFLDIHQTYLGFGTERYH